MRVKQYKVEFLDENQEIIDTERYGDIEPDEDDITEFAIKWKASSGILYSYDEGEEDDTFREIAYFTFDHKIKINY